jgi:sigma-B regulation protein RsbU (phosphoserine phosphatase)
MFGLKAKTSETSISTPMSIIHILYMVLTGLALVLSLYIIGHVSNRPSDECSWEDSPHGIKIVSIQKGGTSDQAGMLPGDNLLKIAGENATSSSRAQAVLNQQTVGDTVPYFIFRGMEPIELQVKIVSFGMPPLYLVMLVIAFLFGLIGLWIVWIRPHDIQARVLFFLFISFMLFWTLNIIPPLPKIMFLFVHILKTLTFTTIPVFYAYFFLLYPKKHRWLKKSWFHFLLFSPSFLILIWYFLALVFNYPSPINFMVGTGLWGIYFSFGLLRLNHVYRKETNRRRRLQMRILQLGITLGIIPPFLRILSPYLGLPFFIVTYSTPLMGLIPISFAYAVVRHRLLDVEFMVKKSFVYALLTGLIVTFYFMMIHIFGQFLQDITKLSGTFIIIISALFVAIVITPVRERLQRIVDRALYRQSYDYRETLKQFAKALNKLIEPDILMDMVLQKICETMKIEQGFFLIGDGGLQNYTLLKGYPALSTKPIAPLPCSSSLCQTMKKMKETVLISEFEINDKATNILLEYTDSIVAVPLLNQEQLSGFLLLGRKKSETLYSAEDFELLSTLADRVGVSLENGKLHQALTEQERLKHELKIAREIQLKSLPQSEPSILGIDIHGCSIPATEVGGDYYDYFNTHKNQFGIVLGDVSGKGTSAALYQSKIQGFVRALFASIHSPKELLCRVNRLTFENIEEKSFATLVAAFIDPIKRIVVVARAGHTPIFYYQKQKDTVLKWEPKGIGIALDKGSLFNRVLKEEKKILKTGDVLLFFTDGLSEAENQRGEEFGEEQLEKVFQNYVHKSCSEIVEGILQSIQDFVKTQSQKDDMTLVVIKME